MSQQLYSSEKSGKIIEKIHDLLGLEYKLAVIARLAISIGLKSGKKTFLNKDANGRKFNNYTILSNDNYYDTLIFNIVKNILNKSNITEEEYFSNNSILKGALDYGCDILDNIYIQSKGDSDYFLKKLYSLKYDKVFLKKLVENKDNISVIENKEINNNLSDGKLNNNIEQLNNEDDTYIKEVIDKVREFLDILKYNVTESDYTLSNSVIRVKMKLPLGKSINSISSRVADLKLHLGINEDIIIGPISGYLCFDIPRKDRKNVYLNDIIDRIDYNSTVKFPLGTSIDNEIISIDLADSNTPHLLIAGATGQGKSECLKSIIGTLIKKNLSEDLKLVLIDPKKVEFSRFKNIPHLYGDIVTEVEEAIIVLETAVTEMNKRYDLLSEYQVNSIDKYNKVSVNKLPKQIIIFDEFADFILSGKEQKERLEDGIKKLSGKARAAGIHLILSTQRPDKDIITGVIKANLPAKIAFKTGSPINSSIIIDSPDACKLFGKGDMLLNKEGVLTRIQGAYISDEDLDEIMLEAK